MKLSEVKGERTFDVIADIIEPIANITEDKEACEIFSKQKPPEGVTEQQFMAKRLKNSIPKLLKRHKKDIISIIVAIEGLDREEYVRNLNLAALLKDCTELIGDEAFMSLFTSAQPDSRN